MPGESEVSVLREEGTPPGWFPPAIQVEGSHSPRPLRSNVSINLIFRLQDARHGLHRLVAGEPFEGKTEDLDLGTCVEDAADIPFDYKETPGSGCESAERLHLIREGKQIVSDDGESNHTRRHRDSLDWYNSCSDSGGCIHLLRTPVEHAAVVVANEDIVVTHVCVPRQLLGLISTTGENNMLFGEVVREFEHPITHAIMYKVDFGGVLGVQAVEKSKCNPICEGDVAVMGVGV